MMWRFESQPLRKNPLGTLISKSVFVSISSLLYSDECLCLVYFILI